MSTILYKNNEKKRIDTPGLCDMKEVLNLIYPVGCYFDTSDSNFDPNVSFIGEWERITNGTILISQGQYNSGTLVEPGTVFGSRYKNLTINNIPSHTHTVGAHSHGLNSHTHAYSKSSTTSGSTTLTTNQIPAHTHGEAGSHVHKLNFRQPVDNTGNGAGVPLVSRSSAFVGQDPAPVVSSGAHTHSSVGGGQGHTHSITLSSTNTGAASGSTANSSEFNTGATGKSEVDSVDVLPPVTCVCRWHRIS